MPRFGANKNTVIRDCLKAFDDGMAKACPPGETLAIAQNKLDKMDRPILDSYYRINRPSGIPQFRFIGTEFFKHTTTMAGTNGKGHTQAQAKASGIMELIERYSGYKYLHDRDAYTLDSFRNLQASGNAFQLEDLTSGFTDQAKGNFERTKTILDTPIRWYSAFTLQGEGCWLPAALSKYVLHGSNGMAAGNTLEEALLQAFCEVIERHCTTEILSQKLSVPSIAPATIRDTAARRLMEKYKKLGHPIWIMDFSLDLKIPVIGVVRAIDDMYGFVTTGVAASRKEALIRALIENSQVEVKDMGYRLQSLKHLFQSSRTLNMADVLDLEQGNFRLELEELEKILARRQMRMLFLNTTDDELGTPAVIAFITGAKHFHEKMRFRSFYTAILEDFLETERYRDAFAKACSFQLIDPQDRAVFHYYRGYAALCLDDLNSACQSLQKSAQLPRDHELKGASLCMTGVAHLARGKTDGAVAAFTKTIEHDRNFNLDRTTCFSAAMHSNNHLLQDRLIKARQLYAEVYRARAEKPAEAYIPTFSRAPDATGGRSDSHFQIPEDIPSISNSTRNIIKTRIFTNKVPQHHHKNFEGGRIMAKIKITDLPENRKVSKAEMKAISGGTTFRIDAKKDPSELVWNWAYYNRNRGYTTTEDGYVLVF